MAQETINNGDSGKTVRDKLNAMFTELYGRVITLAVAASQLDSDLTVANSQAIFSAPHSMTITGVFVYAGTAPVGSSILVDVNKEGTTILSSDLSIAAASNNSSVVVPSVTLLAQFDKITVDINQIGSSTAGKDLTVYILGTQT